MTNRSFRFLSVLCLLLALGAGTLSAQTLAVTANKTVVDGVVHADEYSFTKAFGPITLSASRSGGTLYLAVQGQTTGWVAVGLGSQKMNGATIFMGFVGDDGKPQFKTQAGAGHSHKDASAAVISSALKTAGGTTTLEIALSEKEYLKGGILDLIFAEGADKDFTSYHSSRGSVSLKAG
jgi:hypothetical protein